MNHTFEKKNYTIKNVFHNRKENLHPSLVSHNCFKLCNASQNQINIELKSSNQIKQILQILYIFKSNQCFMKISNQNIKKYQKISVASSFSSASWSSSLSSAFTLRRRRCPSIPSLSFSVVFTHQHFLRFYKTTSNLVFPIMYSGNDICEIIKKIIETLGRQSFQGIYIYTIISIIFQKTCAFKYDISFCGQFYLLIKKY